MTRRFIDVDPKMSFEYCTGTCMHSQAVLRGTARTAKVVTESIPLMHLRCDAEQRSQRLNVRLTADPRRRSGLPIGRHDDVG